MNYIAHDCRNSRLHENHKDYCDNRWIDKDLTKAKTNPPDWKYCRECAEKLGIDYDAQTPTSNLTEKELKEYERKSSLAKLNARKRKLLNMRPQ